MKLKKHTIKPSISPFLLCAALMIAFAFQKMIDNDTYWIIRVGEEIAKNGIPRIDTLTMHEGLKTVQQQWLTAYIYYLLYSTFGTTGLLVFELVLNVILFRLIIRLRREFGGQGLPSYAVTLFGAAATVLFFGVLRPQTITAIVSVLELLCLEKHRKTGDWKCLIALPLLSVVSVNTHAATWPMFLVYFLPFLVEFGLKTLISFRNVRQGLCRDERKPGIRLLTLVGSAALSFGAGFINPYSWRGMTYLLTSVGIPEISGFVAEMKAPSMTFVPALFITTLVYIVLICLGGKLPISHVCLAAGTIFLALMAARGAMDMLLAATPVVACSVEGGRIAKLTEALRRLVDGCREAVGRKLRHKPGSWDKALKISGSILVVITLITSIAIGFVPVSTADFSSFTADTIPEAIDWAEANTDISKDSVIFADYNNGGYLEFRGYKPYIDPRAEIFVAANNGGKDIFAEYLESGKNFEKAGLLVSKYGFEYLFVYRSSMVSVWLRSADRGYEKLYETSDEIEGRIIEVWRLK